VPIGDDQQRRYHPPGSANLPQRPDLAVEGGCDVMDRDEQAPRSAKSGRGT
jgi:hypothetical protein